MNKASKAVGLLFAGCLIAAPLNADDMPVQIMFGCTASGKAKVVAVAKGAGFADMDSETVSRALAAVCGKAAPNI